MGQAIIVKENITANARNENQSIASVKDKVVLSDAKTIDMDDPWGDLNQPRLVDTTSKNIPSKLSWGIREVFFKASGVAVISITGTSVNGDAVIWLATVTKGSNGELVCSDWGSTIPPVVFVGSTDTKNGESGLVPKPLAADADNVLMGNGTWGLPDSIVNRINMIQETLNNIIDALNGSAEIINGSYDPVAVDLMDDTPSGDANGPSVTIVEFND